MAIDLKKLDQPQEMAPMEKYGMELTGISFSPPLRYYKNSRMHHNFIFDSGMGNGPKIWAQKNRLILYTPADCQWRDRYITIAPSMNRVNVQWCYDIIAGYIVTVVKACGLVGVSYCSPADAKPRWEPGTGILLAYKRRRINANIKFGRNQDKQRVVDFVAIDSMVNGFAPQKVLAEIRANYPLLAVRI